MHQPYYKNLLTQEAQLPWVRLHGVKDYLDMVRILEGYPAIHQTFNLVPSLIEQIEDYAENKVKDKYFELSLKPADKLSVTEKELILKTFFHINKEKVIALFPRYYELYLRRSRNKEFSTQDYLDLQAWFNLAWIDASFRQDIPELASLVHKARFFTEEDKQVILKKHLEILSNIIPGYKKSIDSGQIEVSISPSYHPILPLLYSTNAAKEANPKTVLPNIKFAYPQDAKTQVGDAVKFYKERFKVKPQGMWPSEESVSEHILSFFIESGINWIVTDEGILFKSLKKKKRDTKLLYQPYLLKRKEGDLNIVFRDRNLSDLIGFTYHGWKAESAANDFMKHLGNIAKEFEGEDLLVSVAMDGENAWEYYSNDGSDFLNLLYSRISESKLVKAVTISEYLKMHPAKKQIKRLAAGSWIHGEFGKWIGNPYKLKAWEWLALAREELEQIIKGDKRLALSDKLKLAWKQIYICEGSDWFWWYGEEPEGNFDRLFRTHLSNFYTIINKEIPEYLKSPLHPDKK